MQVRERSTGVRGVCVVMAGGRGTRFWPLSRTRRPKQLLPLSSDQTLLRETCERVLPLVGSDRILVITSGDLAPACRAELPEIPPERIIAEPVGRNTAPCAVLGVGLARQIAGDEPVALLPADHYIPEPEIFRQQLARAFAEAEGSGSVVTFGISPTHAETGYGYLEVATAAEGDLLPGAAFVEKPNRERAGRYLNSGRHLWNSGIFVWDPAGFAGAVETHVPEIYRRIVPAVAAFGTTDFATALETAYADCPAESIDYAVMEKITDFRVIRAAFHWSDLGSWAAWGELAGDAGDGNQGRGALYSVKSNGNVIHVTDKAVALVGVQDLVVVDTPDALLVCSRAESERIRDLIVQLEESGRQDLL
jgi:mannose-1-phosphate guanylyltransferase